MIRTKKTMRRRRLLPNTFAGILICAAALTYSAQQPNAPAIARLAAPQSRPGGNPVFPATQINPSNVKSLTPRWLFQHGVIDGVSNQTTPDHRRRRHVCHRSAGKRLRRQRGRRTSAVVLRRHQPDWRRQERLHLPQPRRVLTRTAWSTRRGLVPVRARREDREADPGFGQQRPGQRDPGRHSSALSRREVGDQPGVLVHHGAAGATTASSTSAAPGAKATSPAAMCWPSMRKRARSSGTSIPCRRTKRIRAGTLPARRGSAANATAAGSGKRRRSIRSWGCSTSPSAIRSATARSGRASICSPTRSSR